MYSGARGAKTYIFMQREASGASRSPFWLTIFVGAVSRLFIVVSASKLYSARLFVAFSASSGSVLAQEANSRFCSKRSKKHDERSLSCILRPQRAAPKYTTLLDENSVFCNLVFFIDLNWWPEAHKSVASNTL